MYCFRIKSFNILYSGLKYGEILKPLMMNYFRSRNKVQEVSSMSYNDFLKKRTSKEQAKRWSLWNTLSGQSDKKK